MCRCTQAAKYSEVNWMLAVVQLAMILVMVVVLDAIVNSKLFESKSDCVHKCDTKSKTKNHSLLICKLLRCIFSCILHNVNPHFHQNAHNAT